MDSLDWQRNKKRQSSSGEINRITAANEVQIDIRTKKKQESKMTIMKYYTVYTDIIWQN